MWRTSNTNGHLENHTDTDSYRSFPNIYTHMKEIYMESLNNEEENVTTTYATKENLKCQKQVKSC